MHSICKLFPILHLLTVVPPILGAADWRWLTVDALERVERIDKTAGLTRLIVRNMVSEEDLVLSCHHEITYHDSKVYDGIGVIPDIEVANTQRDVALGRGRILNTRLEILEQTIN